MALLVSVEELAEELRVSRSTVNRLVRAGLPHIKIGRLVRFRMDRVVAFLDREASDRKRLVRRRRP
ncbi:MAG TPA: DNA-binding protein [Candidatus Aminicenantes bacterium]|nr:DNA-binding protein [Candidatus Aminicenantes bacterium]